MSEGKAFRLKDILIITKLAKEHKLKQSRLLKKIGCIPENLSNRLDGIIESINGEEKNQPRNDLRFINGMVGANKLLEIYNKDKDSFKKVYGRIMSKKYQGKFDFDHFFEDIEKAIKSNGWKKIEWNNKIFYIRETDNLPTEEQQSQNVKNSQESDVDENGRKRRKITINNRGKVYKSRTTILMLNKKLELLGVSEVKLEDGDVQAMLSERDVSEARTPTLMNLPPELKHLYDTLYKKYGGGNAIQTEEELRGKGLGKELMYFLISYLKHKKIEKLKVSGYATSKDGKKSEGFFLGTGAKKINDTTSVYENFEYILENLGKKIIKTDEKRNDLIIYDEAFEK